VTSTEEFENHKNELCMHRDIQCNFCNGSYVLSDYAEHYEADIAMLLERKRNYWSKIRKLYEEMESNNQKICMIESIMGKIYSLDFSPWNHSSETDSRNFETPHRPPRVIENNEDAGSQVNVTIPSFDSDSHQENTQVFESSSSELDSDNSSSEEEEEVFNV
jgi:hypothetical protein